MAISDDPSAVVTNQPQGRVSRWDALWDEARRRKAASLAIAIAVEALIVLLLYTLGATIAGDDDADEQVTRFEASDFTPAPEPEPEPEQPPEPATERATPPPQPVTRQTLPQPEQARTPPLAVTPAPTPPPPAQPDPRPSPSATPTANPNRVYGPADTGNPRTANDSAQVGTAPNGEPLFAARWYREPTDQELSGYLSTANGPGAALIACKTVPDYYVEDCVLLGESPPGSKIGRAVMAAAWQFRVRPARIGGREQFGSWVRIRIDYTINRAPR